PGRTTVPVFGQTLSLTNLAAAYGVRGTRVFTKGMLTANPTSWLDLYGQFLYSQPDSTTNYQQTAAGNLFLQSQLLFFTSQQFLLSAQAKMPHTSGNAGAEIRPLQNLRILQSWLTDRLHTDGAAVSSQVLTGTGFSQSSSAQLASALITNDS